MEVLIPNAVYPSNCITGSTSEDPRVELVFSIDLFGLPMVSGNMKRNLAVCCVHSELRQNQLPVCCNKGRVTPLLNAHSSEPEEGCIGNKLCLESAARLPVVYLRLSVSSFGYRHETLEWN